MLLLHLEFRMGIVNTKGYSSISGFYYSLALRRLEYLTARNIIAIAVHRCLHYPHTWRDKSISLQYRLANSTSKTQDARIGNVVHGAAVRVNNSPHIALNSMFQTRTPWRTMIEESSSNHLGTGSTGREIDFRTEMILTLTIFTNRVRRVMLLYAASGSKVLWGTGAICRQYYSWYWNLCYAAVPCLFTDVIVFYGRLGGSSKTISPDPLLGSNGIWSDCDDNTMPL